MILLPSNAEVCLLGDFNVDYLSKQRTNGYALKHKLALFANSHLLNQLIETPTRITEQSATTIDLLFVNNKYRVAESGVMYAHISDHLFIVSLNQAYRKGQENQFITDHINIILRKDFWLTFAMRIGILLYP